jgi:NifU-like protein involved in Fe-S cluster formation
MTEEPIVVAYFKKLFADPAHSGMGQIEDAEVEIKGELCPRRGNKDQVFFYGRMQDGKITAIKYMCALCDPHMFVAADILCKLVVGKTRDEVSALDKDEFEKLLGGESTEGTEHFRRARELLILGILESEERAK